MKHLADRLRPVKRLVLFRGYVRAMLWPNRATVNCRSQTSTPDYSNRQQKRSNMLTTKLFPTILIALDVLAAAGYAYHDITDWRKVVYWISAAVLTYCVTF